MRKDWGKKANGSFLALELSGAFLTELSVRLARQFPQGCL
jgi:hypothetical protein